MVPRDEETESERCYQSQLQLHFALFPKSRPQPVLGIRYLRQPAPKMRLVLVALGLLLAGMAAAGNRVRPLPATQRILSPDMNFTVRLANPRDSSAIAKVLLEAFADLSYFRYVYQYLDQYWRETMDCFVCGVPTFFDDNSFAHVGVVDDTAIVSMAFWDRASANDLSLRTNAHSLALQLQGSSHGCPCPSPAVNMTRAMHVSDGLGQEEQRLLNDVYGDHQLYLALLATLPSFQGHDFAGALLREGLRYGNKSTSIEPLYATLSATEPGEPLYLQNGYASIHNVTVPSIEEDQTFRWDLMVRPLRVKS